MGKIIEDTSTSIDKIVMDIDSLLEAMNTFTDEYTNNYLLKELRDSSVLKERMKDKIESGVIDYDN